MSRFALRSLAIAPPPARRSAVAPLVLAVALAFAAGCGGSVEERVSEAQALQDAGQYGESIATLRGVLEKAPDDAEANFLLGTALVQTGQPSAAVFPLQKAFETELPKKEVRAGMLLATAFLQTENFDDAIRTLDQVLGADPDRTAALRMRAEAKLRGGRAEEGLEDATKLAEQLPDDFAAAGLHASALAATKHRAEAEKEYERAKEIGDKSGDPSQAARGCLALAGFYDEGKDTARAEKAFSECLDAHPSEAIGLQMGTDFFDRIGKPERGTALWQRAVKESPQDLAFRFVLAQRLRRAGDQAGGLALLREAAESFGQPAAWKALADYQRAGGDLEGASASLTKAIEAGGQGDTSAYRFAQADVLVELGRLDEADKMAEGLTEPSHRDLIRGRVLLARGDAAGALKAFDEGIRRWPNNAGARYFAGIAAKQSGDPERASLELQEAMRADPRGTDAALALASLALQSGNAAQAVEYAKAFLGTRDGQRAEALRILARAQAATGQTDAARATIADLAKLPGQAGVAITESAWIELKAGGPAAAVRVIEGSRVDLTDPANEAALRMLAENLVATGKFAAALSRADAALAKHADVASFHELRGAVLVRAGKPDEGKAEFEKALAIDPNNGRAMVGLGALAVARGDLPAALDQYDRAAKAMPDDVAASYAAAQIVFAQGKREEAEARLREVVKRDGGHAGARNDLAYLLADEGKDLDLALVLAEQAYQLTPTPDVSDTVGWVRLKRGDLEAAIAAFRKALAGKPKDPTVNYHLGVALMKKGETEPARAAFREALAAGTFPDADAAREQLAKLDQP